MTPLKVNVGEVGDPPANAMEVLPPNCVFANPPYSVPFSNRTVRSKPNISPGASVKIKRDNVSGSPH